MNIKEAETVFAKLLEREIKRAEAIKSAPAAKDFSAMTEIKIGVCAGDGIGPAIMRSAVAALERLLAGDIKNGKIKIISIEGLTLENRIKCGKAIPAETLAEIKKCDVILKGPTSTPSAADCITLTSANVTMRRELDLYANVRPVRLPAEGIDWIFFRENTEGAYSLGSDGIDFDGLSVDFTVTTDAASERLIRAAFDYAAANGKTRVTAVTKANIVKATDGRFLKLFYRIAAEYKNITADDIYIDIAAAKLLDGERGKLQVFALPNLYGDILTDEAAQIQGGVGTAGSANIGSRYAMFEAVHGSALKMFAENRAAYADPSGMLRAAEMLLRHIGQSAAADKLDSALSGATLKITGFADGATTEEFTAHILKKL